jgi:flagellar basal-body rod modification protein FlgD
MTTPIIGNVADYVGKTPAATNDKAAEKPGGDLGKDTFLKLLVAQLKYQDPGNPMDITQFLAQTAQFTTVEKLNDLAKAEQDLVNTQLRFSASNLIGRTVTFADGDDKTATGVVTAASFAGSTPTLKVGDKEVALADVKEVRNTTT